MKRLALLFPLLAACGPVHQPAPPLPAELVAPAPDAGPRADAGHLDAGTHPPGWPPVDAGEPDAGPQDAGPPDAGPPVPTCGGHYYPCCASGPACADHTDRCEPVSQLCCGATGGVCCQNHTGPACSGASAACDDPTQTCRTCGYTLKDGTAGPCCDDGSCAPGRTCQGGLCR